jgi:hypothetical protein
VTNLHPSTIALSVYNWLAAYASGPTTLEALLAGLRETWDPRVGMDDVKLGIEHARAKKFFIRFGNTIDVVDSQRRILRRPKNTDLWEGWRVMVQRPNLQTIPLAEVFGS